MMRSKRAYWGLASLAAALTLLLGGSHLLQAQESPRQMAFNQTVSGLFEDPDSAEHEWVFSATGLELVEVQVLRIGGQFTPRLRLLAPDGNPLSPDENVSDAVSQTLRFYTDFGAGGRYTIQVIGQAVTAPVDNPDEYSLRLQQLGLRKADPQAGLAIPTIGLNPNAEIPALEQGIPNDSPDAARLGELAIYGASEVLRPEAGTRPQNFSAAGAGFRIEVLQNGNILARLVRSISFTSQGIGLVIQPPTGFDHLTPTQFFTDQSITRLENTLTTLTIVLANGQLIQTDFYRFQSIQAVEGLVVIVTREGRRLVLEGQTFDLRRNSNNDGQQACQARSNNRDLNCLVLDNGAYLLTDLAGWDTLAYLPSRNPAPLSILAGQNFRLFSDTVSLSLLQRDAVIPTYELNPPESTGPTEFIPPRDPSLPIPGVGTTGVVTPSEGRTIFDFQLDYQSQIIPFQLDTFGMGDLSIAAGQLTVQPLDGRTLQEPLPALTQVLLESGAVRFSRVDGTFRTSYPDSSDIETPATLPTSSTQAGDPPLGFDNLGRQALLTSPPVNTQQVEGPVNPLNGNFYYHVTDLLIPSHSLGLEFTRHYNSLGEGLSPDYWQGNLWNASLGSNWRHRWQIELNIRFVPLGQVTLILPDGSSHNFLESAAIPGRYLSNSAPTWMLERREGFTGIWVATRTDGLRYQFDRVGRLERIINALGLQNHFSPLPLEKQREGEVDGFLVMEPYGRRLEVYSNAEGRIVRVRRADGLDIRYDYDPQTLALSGVIYGRETPNARYTYLNGQLAQVSDPLSPYHSELQIRYDAQGRVQDYSENPDGNRVRSWAYQYDLAGDCFQQGYTNPLLTRQTTTVNGEERRYDWTYDDRGRVCRLDTPLTGWFLGFEYAIDTPYQLTAYRALEGYRIRFQLNPQGMLIGLVDQSLQSNNSTTRFEYATLADGHQQQLTRITYPNGHYERFEYDERGQLALWASPITPRDPSERLWRYQYDDWGRLTNMIQPAADGSELTTRYAYDSFGYVSEVSQGSSSSEARITRYQHDLLGRLVSFTDGRGNQTTVAWSNERGYLTSIETPSNLASDLRYRLAYEYDEFGRIVSLSDGGALTTFAYNDLGQLRQQVTSEGYTTRYDYDEADNLLAIYQPDGLSVQRYQYDALNRLSQAISPSGLMTEYRTEIIFNQDGSTPTGRWRYSITDPAQRTTDYLYSPGNRLEQVTLRDSSGLIVGYNITQNTLGNTLSTQYEVGGLPGRDTSISYNLLGLPVEASINGLTTQYSYNAAGRLASVTQAINRDEQRITLYDYNAFGEVIRATITGQDEEGQPLGIGTVYEYAYDENGNLVSITDSLGGITRYTYDELNRLESQSDPLGRSTLYNYDPHGNLIGITDPQNNTRTARYDSSDRLVEITNSINNTVSYQYDPLGQLQRRTERALSTQYTYDLEGNVVAITQRGNENILYSYDVLGRVTSITDFLGRTTTYNYDRLPRLSSIADPLGNSIRYRWNNNGRLQGFEDELQRGYDYTLDSLGRLQTILVRADENIGIQTRLSYDDLGNVLEVRFGTGAVLQNDNAAMIHQYRYTPQGWMSSYTDPLGQEWQLTYDANGRLTQALDPSGAATDYTYDAAGQITQVKHGEALERYEYDRNGNVTRYTAPDGLVTEYEYYANNLLSRQVVGANTDQPRQTIYTYDNLGYLQSVTDPAGNVIEYSYDIFGRLQSIRRNLDDDNDPATPSVPIIQSYTYDVVGNLTSITLPQGNLTPTEASAPNDDYTLSLTYNALDERVRYVDPEDNVWAYSYNADGTLATISDPLGSEITYLYDGMGRVNAIRYPNGAQVNLIYDRVGNLANINTPTTQTRDPNRVEASTTANEVTTYQMNALGQLRAIRDLDDDVTVFDYDAQGNVTQITYPNGQLVNYRYDSQGRVVGVRAGEERQVRRYDVMGRLVLLQTNQGNYRFEYNPFGELIRLEAPALTVTYAYDEVGNVIMRDAGEFGLTRYRYDNLYRLIEVDLDGQTVALSYTPNGQLERIIRPNEIETAYSYDAAGRISSVLHQGPQGVLDRFLYRYDSVGNIVRIERQDAWTVLYSYDAAHQLIGERWLDENNQTRYAINIRYDAAGNRQETVLTEGAALVSTRTLYGYNRENQLQFVIRNYSPPVEGQPVNAAGQERFNYLYDVNGNLIRIESAADPALALTLEYDPYNRLIAINGQSPLGQPVNLRLGYDAFQRLVEWRDLQNQQQYRLHYDQTGLVGFQNLATGEITRYWQPIEASGLWLRATEDSSEWYLNDALGSLRRSVDAQGNLLGDIVAGWNYNAFGLSIAPYPISTDTPQEQPQSALAPSWLGQLYDPNTGFYLLGLRAYDPTSGRFIQRDPLRHDPQGNFYSYAYNRPTYWSDPQGMTPQPALVATSVQLLPDQLLPDVRPNTLLDELPAPPDVASLQAQESARVLTVANGIRSGANHPIGLLSPNLSDFYIHAVRPAPAQSITQAYAPAQVMTNLYQTSQGGLLAAPHPDQRVSPLAILGEVDAWLLQASQQPLQWHSELSAPGSYLALPQVPQPAPYSAWADHLLVLPDLLAETPLLAGLEPNLSPLLPPMNDLPAPESGPSSLTPPQAPLNPSVIEGLEALRQQQIMFYNENWLMTPLE